MGRGTKKFENHWPTQRKS